ncbi:uncharacterized protein LOC122332297 isoform X2 [Puntigrus tetrazona]|uniref:uncharacterized protein LOC122332297 isoform X2 n=1 Tax=Puntigrus tetrazona TaxID=1606681 RepID=UPI001C8AD1D6|nr:uncharacterized protein LOC122332297 isoform X2 [Puntigrus tetrazona]XP_043085564.1 uncharacterized protein LOC122332297 isoform X2 [Puntigrus tetrazona]
MASLRRRRGSIDHPPDMLADVINLQEELNKLQKDVLPECDKHMQKTRDLFNDFKNVHRLVTYATKGAVLTGYLGVVLIALALLVVDEDEELYDIFAGAGAVMSAVAMLCVAFRQFGKTQKGKKLKRAINEELKEFRDKYSLVVDVVEKIGRCTEKILRDAFVADHKARALSQRFTFSFEKGLFQKDDVSKIGRLSGNLSEMIAKVASVPDILKEIVGESARGPVRKKEVKEKAEKCITDVQKGIRQIKNSVKDTIQTIETTSELLYSI